LRHVLYTGFRFSDRVLFNAEIELEHAKSGEGSPGAVSIEFGYVEAAVSANLNIRAGMVLVPVGIVNELHEPPTFFGALRPESERQIIPSTWRANGAGILGEFENGMGYKFYLVEGLDATRFSASGIRSGRQHGAKALAEDFGVTGRLYYTGVPGLDIGGSFYTGNSGQGLKDQAGNEIGARVTLLSAHGTYSHRGLVLRALYARSSIGEVNSLNGKLGLTGRQAIGKSQEGYYLTVAYDVMPMIKSGSSASIHPFVQYEKMNTQKEVPAGFSLDPSKNRTNVTLGLSYKPHPNVAFKADYLDRKNEAGSAVDQFNLGVTYLF